MSGGNILRWNVPGRSITRTNIYIALNIFFFDILNSSLKHRYLFFMHKHN